jgi:IS5 family transposase
MDRAGYQTRGQALKTIVTTAEHDLAHGIVIGQHADHDLAAEQVADVRRGPETERLKLGELIGAADIGDHGPSGGCKVCGHCRSHVTKADETYIAHERREAGLRAALTLTWQNFGKRRAGFTLGHNDT